MKKFFKLILLALLVAIAPVITTFAASKCDYNEQVAINKEAANIKATFEEIEVSIGTGYSQETMEPVEINKGVFKITVFNLTESVYIKVTNDFNKDTKVYRYEDSESGVVTFNWENTDVVTNFVITVYSSNKTSCPNEDYHVVYLTTPRFNEYYDTAACSGNEGFYLCQKYITETSEIDEEVFSSKLMAFVKSNQKDKEGTEEKKSGFAMFKEFVKKNKVPIIVGSTIIVVGGVATAVVVIKKRRSRLI